MRTLIISFVAVWGGLCSVALGQITPFLVEDSGGAQLYPNVSGTQVVWQEFMNGDLVVRGKNVSTGNTFLIDGPNASEMDPVTNGSIVVWRDNRTGNFNLYALDLQSGQQRTLVDEPHVQRQQAVGGNYVVWNDGRNSPSNVPPEFTNYDIYALDLRTGQEFPVCTAMWSQEYPAISGNIIVWSDPRRYNPFLLNPRVSDIYGYDAATRREFLIAADPDGVPQSGPAISGNIVVWVDGNNGGDIRGYDLATNTTFPIHLETPDNYTGQTNPDIDGRYVVWKDGRNGANGAICSIVGYDLLTGQEFLICQGPEGRYLDHPKISGSLVVWDDYASDGTSRIWGAYIPEPASVALLGLGAALLAARRRR